MDYSQITPFNSEDHYHDRCDIVGWDNQWQIENCRLCDLSYLKQENDWVKGKLREWINDIDKIELILLFKFQNGFGTNLEQLQVYFKLEKPSLVMPNMLQIIKDIWILFLTIHYIII